MNIIIGRKKLFYKYYSLIKAIKNIYNLYHLKNNLILLLLFYNKYKQ